VEEFRPVIIDSLVFSLINKRMITEDDFEVGVGEVHRLKDGALKKFLRAYEEKKRSVIKHPTFGYKCTYMRCFELQARTLAKVLLGEVEEYVPFLIR
jgi:CRISPR-associated protein Cas1